MKSWLVKFGDVQGERWDNGFHAFQQLDYFEKWGQRYELVQLGQIIEDDSYGILTPGNVYSSTNPIVFVRATDMLGAFSIDFDNSYHVPEEYFRHKRARLRKNDILLAIKGASIASEKSVAFVYAEPKERTIVNGTIFRFQVKAPHNPFFVASLLETEILKKQIRNLQIPNNAVSYVDKPSIRALRIPLPPRPLQDRIAQIMQDAYATRQAKLTQAQQLLDGLDDFVFDKLHIYPESVSEETRFLKSASKLQKGRFDVDFNMGFNKFDPYKQLVQPVQDVASFPTETRNPTLQPDELFHYIDISSIDIQTGEVIETKKIMGVDAPSRARQVVHTADIIVSTVRPTRGATAIIPDSMDNFICSTGFTIVRSNGKVLPEYLHIALRLSTTREQFGRRSSGSSYPAILVHDIKEVMVPVPDKATQQIIVDEVKDRKRRANQMRQEAVQTVTAAKKQVENMILGKET